MALNAEQLLVAAAGFTQATKRPTSADRPNRLATIDYDYDPDTYPTLNPRLLFDGESTVTRKRWPVVGAYWPHPGDQVVLLPVSQKGWVILGSVSAEDGTALRTPGPVVAGNVASGSVTIEAPGDFASVSAGRAGERTIEYGPLSGSGDTRVFTTSDSATGVLLTSQAHTITSSSAVIRVVDTLAPASSTSRIVQWLAVRGWD